MAVSEEEIRKYITSLLLDYVGRNNDVDKDSRLFHDLKLAGDDAWEFFEEVSKHYGIVEPQFDGSKYFPGEEDLGFWPLSYFKRLDKDRWKPMTIDDLVKILIKAIQEKEVS